MMSMMIREEADFLLVSVLWGVGLTVLYDGLRILRIAVRHAAFMTAIEDLLYWIVTFFAVFLLLFSLNDGKVRWYALAGALAGMWLYHITVSRFLVKWLGTTLGFVLKYLGKLLAFAVKGLAFPVKSVGRLLKKPVRWLTIKKRDIKKTEQQGKGAVKERVAAGRRRKKYRKQNKKVLLGIVLVAALFCGILLYRTKLLQARDADYAAREAELQAQIDDEQEKSEELKEREIFVQTKQYIEEIAKTKLGLVKPGEILIKPKSEE